MKVVHIITRLIIGGAQENTLLNCEDLIRYFGDDVLLMVGPTTGPEGSLMQRAVSSVPIKLIPHLIRNISPLSDVKAYQEIYQELQKFRPETVHTHSAKAGILGRAAAWKLGIPCIVHSVHGAPFYPFQNIFVRECYKICEHWAAKRCHALISVADAMTELMVAGGVAPKEKLTTIYSGMEAETFLQSESFRTETRQQLGFSRNDIVVGKIARLFPLKGHEFVIAAAQSILQRVPNVKFLFAGNGILADRYKREITRLNLERAFVFTGLVPPEKIPAIISATDIIVHTSLREGLARVLPQAFLSGKPVISYDVDGAREVVFNGVTGYLLPPKSITELADAVVRLAENEPLRNSMGRAGRQYCTERFDHRLMTTEIRKIYTKILEQYNNKKE
jgi:glycosyltransferase involved in cell wall biosynthesis